MKLLLPAALAAAFALVPRIATAQSTCTVTTEQLVTIPLPIEHGEAVLKLLAGPVLTAGRSDIVALTDTGRLILVRDGLTGENVQLLTDSIVDFAIADVQGGRARVVAIGDGGLYVGLYSETAGVETLSFESSSAGGDWSFAAMVEAAGDGSSIQIVASKGTTIIRGAYDLSTEYFTEANSAVIGTPIQFLALADVYPDAGLELAVGSSSVLNFYKGLANPSMALAANPLTPLPTASFIDVQRIPKGADIRDSFGVVQRHPATDVFYELTSAIQASTGAPAPSAPIATGHLRHAATAYRPMGLAPGCDSNCTPTDLVFVAATSESLVFQGDPQAVGGMQFSYDATQLSALNLSALVGQGTPSGLRVTAGDLDADGDGDLAYAALFGTGPSAIPQFVLVRNDCATIPQESVETNCLDAEGNGAPLTQTFLGIGVELSIPRPATFPAPANRALVEVFVRQYLSDPGVLPQPEVSPVLFHSGRYDLVVPPPPPPGSSTERSTLDLSVGGQLPGPWPSPASADPMDAEEVLLYMRVTPILQRPNQVDLTGPASILVGSINADLLLELCNEVPLDDIYQASYCDQQILPEGCPGTNGAPLINEFFRRRRIRPMGTPPQ